MSGDGDDGPRVSLRAMVSGWPWAPMPHHVQLALQHPGHRLDALDDSLRSGEAKDQHVPGAETVGVECGSGNVGDPRGDGPWQALAAVSKPSGRVTQTSNPPSGLVHVVPSGMCASSAVIIASRRSA